MAEGRRGCGYRKIGGLYMVADGGAVGCGRFPIPLTVCPCCSAGIKQTRSWTWVNPSLLLKGTPCKSRIDPSCTFCPMNVLERQEKAGLLWIGTAFYPTPAAFQAEADKMGVCRRISTVPKDFKLGETWVLMAHPKAILGPVETNGSGEPKQTYTKGIVFAFKPSRIEKCVTEVEFQDTEEMAKLEKRGITPIILPDIPIHRGSVYDRDKSQIDIEERA